MARKHPLAERIDLAEGGGVHSGRLKAKGKAANA